jgi:type I restriction enzyme, S subunit
VIRRVRLGDVLELRRHQIEIDPLAEYISIGVRSFGKGIFHYPRTVGTELSKLRFFEVRPGELVVSNIKGWEGAIAVSSETEQGTIASNRFLTYVSRDGDVDLSWLRHFLLSDAGLPLIQQASPGSADRNRTLAIDRFEALEIPLPPIDEQVRVAKSLDITSQRASGLVQRVATKIELAGALANATVDSLIWGTGPLRPLSDLVDVNPRTDRPSGEVAFVPMAAVDDVTGAITNPETRQAEEVGSGFKLFRRGDVIFARITPCMQNGKSAIFDDDRWEFGYGSTEFHVLRPKPDVEAAWVHAIVRSRRFRDLAAERFTGTAGQQRVPAAFLKQVHVPVPDLTADKLATLREANERRLTLRALNNHQRTVARALEPSLLNAAFLGT